MGKPSHTSPSRLSPALQLVYLLQTLLLLLLPAHAQEATTQPLLLPSAIVYDASGNLYLAETAHHLIRKLDPTGILTTIAGTGTQGFSGDNGPATAAQLDSPQGLALDSVGNLYIADTHNHRIRKLSLSTTALAFDTASNLYLADTGNHRIRRIDAATGLITTVAGNGTQGYTGDNGPATSASIDSPQGIAFDSANNLYLADTHNHRIRRIDIATGLITTIAGTGVPGLTPNSAPGLATSLSLPHGLTIDSSGNLYLADTGNHRIRRIDAATGLITTVAGIGTQAYTGDNGPATTAALDSPRNPTLSPTALLTLSDTHNQRVRQLTPNATIQTIVGIAPTLVAAPLTLAAPATLTYGTASITATLSANSPISGQINFTANSTTLGTAPLTNNTATLDLSTLPAGTYNIAATYPGDPTHASSQSAILTLTIQPAPTTITLINQTATAPNSPITLATHVSAIISTQPSGTVTLLDGATPVLTTPLSSTGDAAFTLTTLTPGTHTLTVLYNGAANFATSVSAATTLTIATTTPTIDFTLSATAATTQTVTAGGSATYTFAVQTTGSLASPITLAATGLPTFATASFNPAYLPPGSATLFTLTIATQPATTAKSTHQPPQTIFWAVLVLPLTTIPLIHPSTRSRSTKSTLFLAAILSLTLTLSTGCGDRISPASQSTATSTTRAYTITVTGTATTASSNTIQHSTTVSLNLITANQPQ